MPLYNFTHKNHKEMTYFTKFKVLHSKNISEDGKRWQKNIYKL